MIISRFAIFYMLLTLVSCSTQEFAGEGAAVRAPSKPTKPPVSTPSDSKPPEDPGITIDDGGKIASCDPKKMVEDPDATYSWRSQLRAGDDISEFVNNFNKYTRVNVGALYFNAATAKFACQLNGFLDQTGFTAGSFQSPENNNIYKWDPIRRKLLQSNALFDGNQTLKSYNCRGRLKDPCKKDLGWIFQPPP